MAAKGKGKPYFLLMFYMPYFYDSFLFFITHFLIYYYVVFLGEIGLF